MKPGQELQTWKCAPCGVLNVADRTHCSCCHAARAGRKADAPLVPAMDLEEFCARQAARYGERPMRARVERVGVELYLTLDPDTDPPQVFLIANENGVAPCDNFGRPSW